MGSRTGGDSKKIIGAFYQSRGLDLVELVNGLNSSGVGVESNALVRSISLNSC